MTLSTLYHLFPTVHKVQYIHYKHSSSIRSHSREFMISFLTFQHTTPKSHSFYSAFYLSSSALVFPSTLFSLHSFIYYYFSQLSILRSHFPSCETLLWSKKVCRYVCVCVFTCLQTSNFFMLFVCLIVSLNLPNSSFTLYTHTPFSLKFKRWSYSTKKESWNLSTHSHIF